MGQLKQVYNITTIDAKDVQKFVGLMMENIVQVLNGNLEFISNIKSSIISATFNATNTETQFSHTLGKVPIGYIVLSSTAAMSVYSGTTPFTNGLIFLKSSATGTASLLLI